MVGSIGPVLPRTPGQWETQVRIPGYRRLSRVAVSSTIILDGVSDSFMLYFRDIMVGPRHRPSTSSVSDEEIRQMIHEEVAAAIRAEIPEMFGSIKTTLMETFDERYAALTEAAAAAATTAVAAARPQGVTRCCSESSATRSHQSSMGRIT